MFHNVVVAGTFDRLHVGHKAVLSRAFAVGERVTIGLTTDEYVHKYKSKAQNPKSQTNPKLKIQNRLEIRNLKLEIRKYTERKKLLEQWLKENDYQQCANIIPLDDPYGPVVPQSSHDAAVPDVEAMVVSTETRGRAEEINRLRIEAGWKPLAIVEVAMVPAEDIRPISSTRVRKGEIDRNGRLIMPDNLRPELQKPLGRVLRGSDVERSVKSKQGSTLIAVGDVATKTLLDAGVVPSLSIIDGRVGRKPFHDVVNRLQPQKASPFEATAVKSGPGYISGEATRVIKAMLVRPVTQKRHWVLVVDGEEDLLALPAVTEAPLGAVVYYGQPDKGLVEVVVTEEKRQEAIALLALFLS